MFGLVPRGAVLRSVKVCNTVTDHLRVRQRFEKALAAVDWTAPGVPPDAVLMVRKLAPEAGGEPRPFATRVSDALARQAVRARRPWIHADAARADAVWFADDAELAACLALDAMLGMVGDRWWWHGLFGSGGFRQFVRRHVVPRGDVLVPAIALLAGRGSAAAWVARFDTRETDQALEAVARYHGITLPEAGGPALGPAPAREHRSAPRTRGRPQRAAGAKAAARLLAAVPEVLRLPRETPQRRLLATALALAREPGWARTPEFQQALRGVDRAEELFRKDRPGGSTVRRQAPRAGSAGSAPIEGAVGRPVTADAQGVGVPGVSATPAASASTQKTKMARPRTPLGHERVREVPACRTPLPESAERPASSAARERVEEPPPAAPARPLAIGADERQRTVVRALEVSPRVTTQFGGIFYLLNAALALGLYGDFTSPRGAGLTMPPWDWLALVGRVWFAADFVRDPVWDLLAALAARRPNDEPGRDFTAPPAWEIDPGWLAPWGEGEALRVRRTRTRVRILHPAGFALRDALLHGGPAMPRRRARARWLAHLLQYLTARLARAMGTEGPTVAALLCRHRADVSVSASRVDLYLGLADLPLSIRQAGLDRDPGWIPAAGRSVWFHFS